MKSKLRDELLLILKREVGQVLKGKFQGFKEKNDAKVSEVIVSFDHSPLQWIRRVDSRSNFFDFRERFIITMKI